MLFVAEFRHVFELFDKNGDGSIDGNEIGFVMNIFRQRHHGCGFSSRRQVMRSLGLNPTNKEIADLIAEVDKSGRLTLFLISFDVRE